jgi:hypothetical protein
MEQIQVMTDVAKEKNSGRQKSLANEIVTVISSCKKHP